MTTHLITRNCNDLTFTFRDDGFFKRKRSGNYTPCAKAGLVVV